MIKEIHFENWKSFRRAVLPIDPLTVIIGLNASGKTNAVEGLEFLRRVGVGHHLGVDDSSSPSRIRGEFSRYAYKSENRFTLKTLVQGEDENTDYLYSITVNTTSDNPLHSETLKRLRHKSETNLDRTDLYQTCEPDVGGSIVAKPHSMDKKKCSRDFPILHQLAGLSSFSEEVTQGIDVVTNTLQGIFMFAPDTDLMRGYSPVSAFLARDGSNIAGVLAELPKLRKKEVENTLSKYLAQLPEGDIQQVWAESVGRLDADAMLYCEEEWIRGQTTLVDAKDMSDGTLRFIAILTALLTRPEGSQLIIEEVDNALHPSRAHLLLKMLQEIGGQRNIDVLVTTHNPALLDAMGLKMVPFVVVAHRDRKSGESKLTPLEDIENLPKLIASGPVGKIVSQGTIEKSLSRESEAEA